MAKTIKISNILHRSDTVSEWSSKNPVLMKGEIGIEDVTGKIKLGDGVTPWKTLRYEIGTRVPENALFTDTTYGVATQTTNGLMSAADKKKLDESAGGGSATFVKWKEVP